ncbi:tRNA 5-methoxyuridine(34)/uridine 5-oxyacetic acid(34) synthase CmoB [uncultured Desulfuromonas sp.]|uniref:tRNA 5-methoxyuridine(34)/uridine 5-oxyacetic acid(34) synthase CmoB n=1 Tax=uncultured Desulfuromonas sp. TaxID=181013 RepID=UPI002AAB7EDA|nr:tRNA 5-methoxyuridine(34)/uridine 5-oxyacetic acid(34) synthase CmoB [uncultured Desulfuromonas sp.]
MFEELDKLIGAMTPGEEPVWAQELTEFIEKKRQFLLRDRKSQAYLQLLENIPDNLQLEADLDRDWVSIGKAGELPADQDQQIQHALFGLRPWRKGPFKILGTEVDTEWVSYLKWNRLKEQIAPLQGRRILDVGSSSGYYLFRMLAADPQLVIGLEPYQTFYFQYCLLQKLLNHPRCYTLPGKFEELPEMTGSFDTLFHMGVLYHVRSPLDTLTRIRRTLRRGGELVLETLVIPGEEQVALTPSDRYAKMNNVFFLPTVNGLANWLARAGFTKIRCIDVTRTTSEEQRKTPWIQTESLADFLDPQDALKTIEGYPAPRRALMLAEVK